MRKQTSAFLRMAAVGGDYPIPTSEAAYEQYTELFGTVMPANGGTLQADGTWLQVAGKTETDFAQGLKAKAQARGQLYIPSCGAPKDNLYPVLDDDTKWAGIASALVTLATTGRFDSPWDAVNYDVDAVASSYLSLHEQFLAVLSTAVRAAGLEFHISTVGVLAEYEDTSYDLDALDAVADVINYYMYNFNSFEPQYTGPYCFARLSLENALPTHGISPSKIRIGPPTYSKYWEVDGVNPPHEIVYNQAIEIMNDGSASQTWVEKDDVGIIREYTALPNGGRLWFAEGSSFGAQLELVDDFNLGGMMMFCPEMIGDSAWDVMRDWLRGPQIVERRRVSRRARRSNWRQFVK